MDTSPHDAYLAAQVTTAPPEKLCLLLVESAIRFVRQAEKQWDAGENDEACESLIRAQEIVSGIIGGFRRDVAPGLVARAASVYGFIRRSLLEGTMRGDRAKVAEALRVLEIEQATWRQLCDRNVVPQTASGASPPPLARERFALSELRSQAMRFSCEA